MCATISKGELSILPARAQVIRVTPSCWAIALKALRSDYFAAYVQYLARSMGDF